MNVIKTEEIQENEITYIVKTYDNGTVEKYIKPDPNYVPPEPEPPQEPVTLYDLQAQIKELQIQSSTTGEQVAEMYAVQAGDVVSKIELDEAYREGVNSVG